MPTPVLKTQGETESDISVGINRHQQELLGRGAKSVDVHLIGTLVVVRLTGVLTAAEQHLAQSCPTEKGRNLIKQIRTHLVESARPKLEAMVQAATGVRMLSLHHDISTVTGEEVIVATLEEPPCYRDTKRR